MTLQQFKIQIHPGGLGGDVEVNGEDVGHQIVGFTLNAEVGQVAELVLYSASTGTISGEADVRWQGDEVKKMVAFLEGLDPEEIQNKAMAQMGWGEERTLAELVIEEIKNELKQRDPAVRPWTGDRSGGPNDAGLVRDLYGGPGQP